MNRNDDDERKRALRMALAALALAALCAPRLHAALAPPLAPDGERSVVRMGAG